MCAGGLSRPKATGEDAALMGSGPNSQKGASEKFKLCIFRLAERRGVIGQSQQPMPFWGDCVGAGSLPSFPGSVTSTCSAVALANQK